jgi:hypothetical protein
LCSRQRSDFGHRQARRAIKEAAVPHFPILQFLKTSLIAKSCGLDRKELRAMQAGETDVQDDARSLKTTRGGGEVRIRPIKRLTAP